MHDFVNADSDSERSLLRWVSAFRLVPCRLSGQLVWATSCIDTITFMSTTLWTLMLGFIKTELTSIDLFRLRQASQAVFYLFKFVCIYLCVVKCVGAMRNSTGQWSLLCIRVNQTLNYTRYQWGQFLYSLEPNPKYKFQPPLSVLLKWYRMCYIFNLRWGWPNDRLKADTPTFTGCKSVPQMPGWHTYRLKCDLGSFKNWQLPNQHVSKNFWTHGRDWNRLPAYIVQSCSLSMLMDDRWPVNVVFRVMVTVTSNHSYIHIFIIDIYILYIYHLTYE